MSREREAELVEILNAYKGQEVLSRVLELFTIRRERFRDRLENEENAEMRGRAKECKEMIQIFS
jgi:hypothetical protein